MGELTDKITDKRMGPCDTRPGKTNTYELTSQGRKVAEIYLRF